MYNVKLFYNDVFFQLNKVKAKSLTEAVKKTMAAAIAHGKDISKPCNIEVTEVR